MRVTVVHAASAHDVRTVELELGERASIGEALAAFEVAALCAPADRFALAISVWGRRADPSHPLSTGDRIELCRPLLVDPKTARRERFARQGPRGAGLFAGMRGRPVVSKPGSGQS